MASVIAITDSFLDQTEVHFGRDDASVVRSNLEGDSLYEALNVFSLLVNEVVECVDQLSFLIWLKDVHLILDSLHFFALSILDVPETHTGALFLTKLIKQGLSPVSR